jgi:hypothetical protein
MLHTTVVVTHLSRRAPQTAVGATARAQVEERTGQHTRSHAVPDAGSSRHNEDRNVPGWLGHLCT